MTKLIPRDDRVLILPDPKEDTYHGIIHLPNMGYEKSTSGVIISKGQNASDDLQPGDHVLFGKYAGVDVNVDEKLHHIVREDDILAHIIEED